MPPQSPSENLGNDQAIQDQNDFMQMMNPKMEPQDYDESQDGLDMMADDSVGQDPLVQQLLGGGDGKGNMPGNIELLLLLLVPYCRNVLSDC